MHVLNSLAPKAKLIQVISTAIKHANKSFLSRRGGFFPHFFLWIEGWLWIGWVVGFDWFECFLFFVVVRARIKLEHSSPPLSHMSQTQHPICMWIWLHSLQHGSNHSQSFFHKNSLLKMCSHIGNLLL
jgi:hypothetical protein